MNWAIGRRAVLRAVAGALGGLAGGRTATGIPNS